MESKNKKTQEERWEFLSQFKLTNHLNCSYEHVKVISWYAVQGVGSCEVLNHFELLK